MAYVCDNPKLQSPIPGQASRSIQHKACTGELLEGVRTRRIDRQRHDPFEHIGNTKVKGETVVGQVDQIGLDSGLCVESVGEIFRAIEVGFCEAGKEIFKLRGGIEDARQVLADERERLVQVVGRTLQVFHEHGDVIEAGGEVCRHSRRVTREQEPRLKRFQLEQMMLLLLHRP